MVPFPPQMNPEFVKLQEAYEAEQKAQAQLPDYDQDVEAEGSVVPLPDEEVESPSETEAEPDFGVPRYLNSVDPLLTNEFDGTVEELLEALREKDEVLIEPAAFARLVVLANIDIKPPFHPGDGNLIQNLGVYLIAPRIQIPIFGCQLVIADGSKFVGMGPNGAKRAKMETWIQVTIDGIEDRTNIALTCDDNFLRTQALISAMAGLRLEPRHRRKTDGTAGSLIEGLAQVVEEFKGKEEEEEEAGESSRLFGLTPDMMEIYPLHR
jgi:hypothetical protein